jgi:hypothetical protein
MLGLVPCTPPEDELASHLLQSGIYLIAYSLKEESEAYEVTILCVRLSVCASPQSLLNQLAWQIRIKSRREVMQLKVISTPYIIIIIYKVQAYWHVPISRVGDLVYPSHRWSTSVSSSFRAIVEYFPRDSVGWHS